MIFNCCGEGSQIEKNKQRISRCKELAKDELLEIYTDTFVNGLIDSYAIKENLEFLFYEKISTNILENNINDVNKFSYSEIEELKNKVYQSYKKRPTSGYLMCVSTHINNIIANRI